MRPSNALRRGDGATLIECKTYRTRPHAEGMGDYTYRTREDVERWKTQCPIHASAGRSSRARSAPTPSSPRLTRRWRAHRRGDRVRRIESLARSGDGRRSRLRGAGQ